MADQHSQRVIDYQPGGGGVRKRRPWLWWLVLLLGVTAYFGLGYWTNQTGTKFIPPTTGRQ